MPIKLMVRPTSNIPIVICQVSKSVPPIRGVNKATKIGNKITGITTPIKKGGAQSHLPAKYRWKTSAEAEVGVIYLAYRMGIVMGWFAGGQWHWRQVVTRPPGKLWLSPALCDLSRPGGVAGRVLAACGTNLLLVCIHTAYFGHQLEDRTLWMTLA